MSRSTPVEPTHIDPANDRPGTRELGPSDSSDSGSDILGSALDADSDTDAAGTGEGLDADGRQAGGPVDLATDHIISAEELKDEDKEI